MNIQIRLAALTDLNAVVPLFDAYRQFYRKPSDPEGARRFLRERFEQNQSVMFLAVDEAKPLGFTQLYPSFSSSAMAPIFVLNDLFVTPEARRRGVGEALLQAAIEYGKRTGAVRLTLSTEVTNRTAQSLYERSGWKRDEIFYVYQFLL